MAVTNWRGLCTQVLLREGLRNRYCQISEISEKLQVQMFTCTLFNVSNELPETYSKILWPTRVCLQECYFLRLGPLPFWEVKAGDCWGLGLCLHAGGPGWRDDPFWMCRETQLNVKDPLITLRIFIEVSSHCNKKLLKHKSPTELLIIGKYILNTVVH